MSCSANGRQTNSKEYFNIQPKGSPHLRGRDQHTLQEDGTDQCWWFNRTNEYYESYIILRTIDMWIPTVLNLKMAWHRGTEHRPNIRMKIRSYCDVHAVARFRGNRGGCLSNDWWMFPRNPFQERVSSLRRRLLFRPPRGHIFRTESRCCLSSVFGVFGVRELELVTKGRGREPGVRRLPRLQRLWWLRSCSDLVSREL
jgi:hypothetical protein